MTFKNLKPRNLQIFSLVLLGLLLCQSVMGSSVYTSSHYKDSNEDQQIDQQNQEVLQESFEQAEKQQQSFKRNLALGSAPIRITSDMNQSSSHFQEQPLYIQRFYGKVFKQVSQFFKMNLNVLQPIEGNNIPSNEQCAGIKLSDTDLNQGIPNSDHHFYWVFINDSSVSYKYKAVACSLDKQNGNGRINFSALMINKANLEQNDNFYQSNRQFQRVTKIFIHEMIHVLGFDNFVMRLWNQQGQLSEQNKYVQLIQNKPHFIGPKSTKYVKSHFQCFELEGVPLEPVKNDPTSTKTDLLDKTLFGNEIMTPYFDPEQVVISEITWTLLEDSGWYQSTAISSGTSDKNNWGFDKGCDFIFTNKGQEVYPEFKTQEFGCTLFHEGIGVKSLNSQGIPVMKSLNNRVCTNSENYSENSMDKYLGNTFGHNSLCFESNVAHINYQTIIKESQNKIDQFRCHEFQCTTGDNNQKLVSIKIDGQYHNCDYSSLSCNVQTQNFVGTVTMPQNINGLCQDWPKTCPNDCSQNGICQKGKCYCMEGYAGHNCSQKCEGVYVQDEKKCYTGIQECPQSGMIYNDNNKTCKFIDEVCTDGQKKYQNKCYDNCPEKTFKHPTGAPYCLECQDNCLVCYQKSICEQCETGFLQVKLVQNNVDVIVCTKNCPIGYFQQQNQCEKCLVINCLNCQYNDMCRVCNPGFYLLQGRCVEQCNVGQFVDRTNNECKICSTNCSIGCIESADNCKKCEKNADGLQLVSFLNICLQKCPLGYYLGQDEYTCQKCHITCGRCVGPSEYQCLSCPEKQEVKDDLGNISIIRFYYVPEQKTCTRSCQQAGYPFTNQLTETCEKCWGNCRTCKPDDKEMCTSCKQGLFLNIHECLDVCPDGTFKIASAQICYDCPQYCATCTNKSNCLSCKGDYFLYKGQCIIQIPQGYYKDNNNQLQNCIEGCLNCIDGVKCLMCNLNKGFRLNNESKCVDTCQDGFFRNPVQQSCQQCDYSCATCLNSETCLTCQQGFYVQYGENNQFKCVKQCQVGNFPYQFTDNRKVCYPCRKMTPYCTSCNIDGICNKCQEATSTSSGYILNAEHQCVLSGQCSTGYYTDLSIQQCKPCHFACKECKGYGNDLCSACNQDFYLAYGNYCTKICPQGMFGNQDQKCQKCPSLCATCNANQQCLSCNEPLFLYQGECMQVCPSKFIGIPGTNRCLPCHATCGECSGISMQQCKTCATGLVFQNGICTSTCVQIGYYPDREKQECLKCMEGCLKCDKPTYCFYCDTSKYILQQEQGQCVLKEQKCENNQFLNQQTGNCEQCHDACQSCYGQSNLQCKGCNQDFIQLNQSTCVKECPKQYFLVQTSTGNYCKECNYTCSSCTREGCMECKEGYLLHKGQCVKLCPIGFTRNDQQQCQECSQNCKACFGVNDNQCSACKDTFYLLKQESQDTTQSDTSSATGTNVNIPSQKCVSRTECGEGYSSTVNQQCIKCYEPCQTCGDQPYKCTSCQEGLVMFQWTQQDQTGIECLKQCPWGHFQYKNQCQKCLDNCGVCQEGNKCIQCQKGFIVNSDGQCEQGCSAGFYEVTVSDSEQISCKPCDTTCLTCTIEKCMTCRQGYNLDQNGKCSDQCPIGLYKTSNGECLDCPLGCKACLSKERCIECKSGTLLQGKCVDSCPEIGYFKKQVSNTEIQCVQCDQRCLKCTGSDNTNCKSCRQGFYLNGTTCSKECVNGTFTNNDTMQCDKCSSICNTCNNSPFECTSCPTGLILNNKRCVKECPDGYTNINNSCLKCQQGCKTCTPNGCSSCIPPLFVLEGKCVNECNDGSYLKITSDSTGITKQCDKCLGDCKTCAKYNDYCLTCIEGKLKHPFKPYCMDASQGDTIPFYYLNNQNNVYTLEKCIDGCYKCLDSRSCTKCTEQKEFINGQCLCSGSSITFEIQGMIECLQECPNQYYVTQISTGRICKKCPDGCEKCTVNGCEGTCTEGKQLVDGVCVCPSTLLTYKDQCLDRCPQGYYNENSQCKVCRANCIHCGSAEKCYECNEGLYMFEGQCLDPQACPAGTLANEKYKKCIPCPQGCKTCSQQGCQTCQANFYYNQQECTQRCPQGTYANAATQECNSCQSSCISCQSKDICDKCEPSKYLFKAPGTNSIQECLSECIEGYFANEATQRCTMCPKQCSTCDKYGQCTGCSSVAYLISGTQKCVFQCPNGYYLNKQNNNQCDVCEPECKICSGAANNCTRCSEEYFTQFSQVNGQYKTECLFECQAGYYPVGTNIGQRYCKQCHPYCKTCTGYSQQQCQECNEGKFLLDTVCFDKCPFGFYAQDNLCKACDDSCNGCQGSSTTCLKCSEDYLRDGDFCVKECDDFGYYPDFNQRQCIKCHDNCSKCTGPSIDQCQECNHNISLKVIDQELCVAKCPKGYFMNPQNDTQCIKCEVQCGTCSTNASVCTSCTQGYYETQQGSCSKTCENGFYGDRTTQKCQKCHDTCETCFYSSQDSCKTCPQGKYQVKSSCLNECPKGWFGNNENKTCQQCSSNCGDCLDNAEKCTSCNNGFLNEDKCVNHCGYYKYGNTETKECQLCGFKCVKCDDNGACYSCEDGFVLNNDNRCVSKQVTCKDGQYLSGNKCEECDNNCKICFAQQNSDNTIVSFCEQCSDNFILSPTDGQCKQQGTPIDGFYYDQEINQYFECNEKCSTCSSKYVCTSCKTSYIKNGDICVQECSNGQFIQQNTAGLQCVQCHENCTKCYGASNTQCKQCKQDLFWFDYTCLPECPEKTVKYYIQTASTTDEPYAQCKKCNQGCSQCQQEYDYCTACEDSFFLHNNKCVKECEKGYYIDQSSGQLACSKCHDACQDCFGSDYNQCKSCSTGWFLNYPYDCQDICQDGFFKNYNENRCDRCNIKICRTCDKSSENCLTCSQGYFMINGICQEECPIGTYGDRSSQKCEPCISGCKSCKGPQVTDCDQCIGDYLYSSVNDQCTSKCSEGYFADYEQNICVPCDQSCLTCDSKSTCNLCNNGYYPLQDNNLMKCYQRCPQTYYLDQQAQICNKCNDNCETCYGSADQCTSCPDSLLLWKDKQICVDQCANGYFEQEKRCYQCSQNCLTCSENYNICTSCPQKYFLVNNKCILDCPQGTYKDFNRQQCLSCHNTCSECYGPEQNQCTICSDNLVLQDNECFDQCQSGYYATKNSFDGTQLNNVYRCAQCSANCQECQESENMCTSCPEKMNLVNGQCITQCEQGQYKDTTNNCQKCSPSCLSCFGGSSYQCSQCAEGYILQGTQCRIQCKEGYFVNYRYLDTTDEKLEYCEQCIGGCQTCTGYQECQSCNQGFYLVNNWCYKECPRGYYLESTTSQQCNICDDTCVSCYSFDKCTACKSGFYLYEGKCRSECPSYGFEANDSTNTCTKCTIEYCLSCNQGQCNQCQEGFQLQDVESTGNNSTDDFFGDNKDLKTVCICNQGTALYKGVCISTAPDGYYIDFNTSTLKDCDQTCKTCKDQGADMCTSCISDLYFNYRTNQCLTSCVQGFYASPNENACLKCRDQCETCSNGYSCDTCGPNLFKQENQCVYQCTNGLIPNKSSMECQECQLENCKYCNYEGTLCKMCESGFALFDYTCVKECPQQTHVFVTYNDSFSTCKTCSDQCKFCKSDPNYCTECKEGYLMYKDTVNEISKCVKSCPVGFYVDEEFGVCGKCNEKCLYCTGPKISQCQKCATGLALVKNTCQDFCPEGKMIMNGRCIKCNEKCGKCANTIDNCIDCAKGYYFERNVCTKCDDICGTCEGSSDNCLTCAPYHYISITDNNQCVKDCGDGFYGNKALGKCQKCSSNCQTCFGPLKNQCILCQSGFVGAPLCLLEKPNCQIGTYLQVQYSKNSPISYDCLDCSQGCEVCYTQNTCKECKEGYYNTQDIVAPKYTCIEAKKCETGEYAYYNYNKQEFMCKQCQAGCEDCELNKIFNRSTLICKKCSNGYQVSLQNNKTCVKQTPSCEDSQYALEQNGEYTCSSCPEGCTNCQLQNNKKLFCGGCEEGFYLRKNKYCVENCKNNQFQNPKTEKCQNCNRLCATCDKGGKFGCKSCIDGYELQDEGNCIKKTVVALPKCIGQAYYNKRKQQCICFDRKNKSYYDIHGCLTQDEYLELTNCSTGDYFDETLQKCIQCRTNNDENYCSKCDGSEPQDCQQCIDGYYLDKSNYKCVKCDDNCSLCSAKGQCDVCDIGTFKSIIRSESGFTQTICNIGGCTEGTLPYVNSLFYLNSELFSATEKYQFYAQSQLNNNDEEEIAADAISVAIGANHQPIIDSSTLPWIYDNKQAFYEDELISLECIPCFKNCDKCLQGLYLHENNCMKKCPEGYYVDKSVDKNSNVCVEVPQAANTSKVTEIKHLSIDSEGIQNFAGNTILKVEFQGDKPDSVWWSIVEVYNQENGGQEDYSTNQLEELLSGTVRSNLVLKINEGRLQPNKVYIVKVMFNDDENNFSLIKVLVKEIDTQRNLQDIGVNPSLVFVDPVEGLAGETDFYAKYEYSSETILSQVGWIFQIIVGEKGIIYTSKEVVGEIKFQIPQIKDSEEEIPIIFRARKGNNDDYYDTLRYIKVQKNEDLNVIDSQLLNRLKLKSEASDESNAENKMTVSDIMQSAAMIANEVFNSEDKSSTITQFKTYAKQVVKEIGQVEVDDSNIEATMKVLELVAESKIVDKESQKNIQDIIIKVASNINNTTSMEKMCDTISQVNKNSKEGNVEGQTEEEKKQASIDMQKSLVDSVKKWSSNFNVGNPKGVLDTENIQGVVENFNSEVNDLENGISGNIESDSSEEGTQTNIPKGALGGKTNVNLSQMITNGDFITLPGSDKTTSKQTDISLVDPETQQPLEIKDLSEEDAITFQLKSENTTTLNSDQQERCAYWDNENNEFSTKGVKSVIKKVVNEAGETEVYVECQTTHLTSFAVQILEAIEDLLEPIIRPRIYVYGFSSLLGFSALGAFVLISLLL